MENIVKILKSNKKQIVIGSIAVAVLLVGLVAYRRSKKRNQGVAPEPGDPDYSTVVSWPLKRKAASLTNPEEQALIRKLQRYLNTKISYVDEPLEVDGYFGPKTEEQVKLFLGVRQIPYSLYQEIIGG